MSYIYIEMPWHCTVDSVYITPSPTQIHNPPDPSPLVKIRIGIPEIICSGETKIFGIDLRKLPQSLCESLNPGIPVDYTQGIY